MSRNVRDTKWTISAKESPSGTAAARDAVLPVKGLPSFRATPEWGRDQANIGLDMNEPQTLIAINSSGDMGMSCRPVTGLGRTFNSCLGQEGTPNQIGAIVRIKYSGSDASAKISADTSADTLTSETGALGSETGDTNFGTSGDIDLTDLATDTVTELVSVIDGYTDYQAELVAGDGSTDAGDIVSVTEEQGKDNWVYLVFTGTSGAYDHFWDGVFSSSERPTYSIQGDNLHDNRLYTGWMANRISLSAQVKGFVDMSVNGLAFDRTGSQSANSSTLPDRYPFIMADASFYLGGTDFSSLIRSVEVNFDNQANPDGFTAGSKSRAYHEKGMFSVTGSIRVRYAAASAAYYSNVFNGTLAGLSLHFVSAEDLGTTGTKGYMIVHLPYVQLGDYDDSQEQNGQVDAQIPFEAVIPRGTYYGEPVQVHLSTTDSAAY